MPRVSFDSLPGDARLWIFAADRPVVGDAAARLLGAADRFLDEWKAHGEPLTAGREWLHDRFLVVAVDQRDAHASGCSVDGLFRAFRELQHDAGAQIVGGGRVFYRDPAGTVHCIARDEVASRVADGRIAPDTPVLDTSLTSLADWRDRFERPARDSWIRALAPIS